MAIENFAERLELKCSSIFMKKDLLIELQNEAESQETTEQIVKTKSRLKEMLQNSKYFTAETLLPKFPASSLYEERALLLGSLGKHKEALTLYLYEVRNSTCLFF